MLNNILFIRCGTPGYVSPEIANLKNSNKEAKYDKKCDIFSAGVLFHLLYIMNYFYFFLIIIKFFYLYIFSLFKFEII